MNCEIGTPLPALAVSGGEGEAREAGLEVGGGTFSIPSCRCLRRFLLFLLFFSRAPPPPTESGWCSTWMPVEVGGEARIERKRETEEQIDGDRPPVPPPASLVPIVKAPSDNEAENGFSNCCSRFVGNWWTDDPDWD